MNMTTDAPLSPRVLLVILDGWGLAEDAAASAIDQANTPFFRHLWQTCPHTTLQASEQAVGLPTGQMGNSEVGHINLGAGRVVYQELEKISRQLASGALIDNPVFRRLLDHCLTRQRPLHVMGLVSDGGVHSSIVHLERLLDILNAYDLPAVYLHVFTDGRDTPPHSGLGFVERIERKLAALDPARLRMRIASVMGRYYAMDRDRRWERTRRAYDLLVHGTGGRASDAASALEASYAAGITDEFVEPVAMTDDGTTPLATLQPHDALLNFNFRTDRNRQISTVLTQEDMPDHGMQTLPLFYATMNRYDRSFRGIEVLFERETIKHTLGEVLEAHGKTQIRIAETEKYPHVTFFFNGGREEPFEGERRILIPSPKVATYDQQPEMSAAEVTAAIVPELEAATADFVCLNFANPDMVGHTGNFEAAVRACETVDHALKSVVEAARRGGYHTLILSDHGNADRLRTHDGAPHTAHTLQPVPLIYVGDASVGMDLKSGKLGDIAPTILQLMGLPVPEEMTGNVLVHREQPRVPVRK